MSVFCDAREDKNVVSSKGRMEKEDEEKKEMEGRKEGRTMKNMLARRGSSWERERERERGFKSRVLLGRK